MATKAARIIKQPTAEMLTALLALHFDPKDRISIQPLANQPDTFTVRAVTN